MDIGLILSTKYPEGGWGSVGETYESLIWEHPTDAKPTEAELEQLEQTLKFTPLDVRLENLFLQALNQHAGALPPLAEAEFWIMKDGVAQMAKNGRIDSIAAKLNNVKDQLPEELKPVIDLMLAEL